MLKYLLAAMLLVPTVAFAGQTSARFFVGMRIIADTAATNQAASTTLNPSRRYVSIGRGRVRVQVIEF